MSNDDTITRIAREFSDSQALSPDLSRCEMFTAAPGAALRLRRQLLCRGHLSAEIASPAMPEKWNMISFRLEDGDLWGSGALAIASDMAGKRYG
jgi:hypothetical protein